MYQGIMKPIYAMTVEYITSGHHLCSKCTELHFRQLFVSMCGATSFLQLLGSLSLKLGSFHVNHYINLHFHSQDQSSSIHFPFFCLPPSQLCVIKALFLFAEVQRSHPMMRIMSNIFRLYRVIQVS